MKTRQFFLIALSLIGSPVLADYLRWAPPTTREDGSALDPYTELQEYRLYCSTRVTYIPARTTNGVYPIDREVMLPGPGDHLCHMTAVDVDNSESMPSNSVVISSTEPPPDKPAPAQPTQFALMTGTPPPIEPPPDPIEPPGPDGTVYLEVDPRDQNHNTGVLINNQSTESVQSVRLTFTNAMADWIRPADAPDYLVTSPPLGGNNDETKAADFIFNLDPDLAPVNDWSGMIDLDSVDGPISVSAEVRLDNGMVLAGPLTNNPDTDDENPDRFIATFPLAGGQ